MGSMQSAGRALGRFFAGFAALAVAAVGTAAMGEGDAGLDARIRPLVARAMEGEGTAGLQVAVVLEDGRRWAAGFGVADMDTGRMVDVETRFYIASTTKALTALTVALLDARGEIDLDQLVVDALPDVEFPECFDAEHVTVRDLLTHTHGLQNGLVQWRTALTGEFTNDLLVELLAGSECYDDRSFRYSNLGYDIAGLILDRDEAGGWREVVAAETLAPLGMTHTTSAPSTIPADAIAMPHEFGADGFARIRLTKLDPNMGAAGGHFTTASDLGRLLLAELNAGALDGEQVIPAAVIAETQRAQVPQERTFIHYVRTAWGLGWDIGTYEDETVIHRPGGFAGYYSNAAFFPEHGFGVAVLVNGGSMSARLAEAVVGAIADEMLGRSDAMARLDGQLEELAATKERVIARLGEAEPAPATADAPTRAWDAYVGQFASARWGTLSVTRTEAGLNIAMGPMESALAPLADAEDAFLTRMFGDADVARFVIGEDGQAVSIAFDGESDVYGRVE